MSQEKEMPIGFMLAFSENPDKILDNIHSPADVDHLITERIEYAKSQKVENENLAKEPHVNVSITSSQNYVNPVDYESIYEGTSLTQESVDTEFLEEKVDNYYTATPVTFDSKEEEDTDFHRIDVCDMVELQDLPCKIVEVDIQKFPTTIMDELELWESIEIPGTPIRLTEGQILEEFMLEEEIEFQGIDKCKIMELPDEQEIEESIKEEVSNIILPERYRAEESIQKDELKLETPIISKEEISELPKEVKLEIPTEQNGSKLGQDVNMDSDVPTPFHVVPNRNILGKSISKLHNVSKLHARQRKVLESKFVRRENPTRLVKRKISSMYRPSPKPPDRQNSLNVKTSK